MTSSKILFLFREFFMPYFSATYRMLFICFRGSRAVPSQLCPARLCHISDPESSAAPRAELPTAPARSAPSALFASRPFAPPTSRQTMTLAGPGVVHHGSRRRFFPAQTLQVHSESADSLRTLLSTLAASSAA